MKYAVEAYSRYLAAHIYFIIYIYMYIQYTCISNVSLRSTYTACLKRPGYKNYGLLRQVVTPMI